MADLFEGFKWREVGAVVVAMVFFVSIIVAGMQDVRATLYDLDGRLRHMELRQVAIECSMSPEVCRLLGRDQ